MTTFAVATLVLVLTAPLLATVSVRVQLDNPQQRIDGFGASTAWYADELSHLTDEARDELFGFLFGDDGLGLDILRVRIAPHPGDGPEPLYDWNHDTLQKQAQVVRHIQQTYGVTVMAVPWTAPEWMKTNAQHKHGGRLKPELYDTYAQYLVQWVQGMQQHFGVKIDILSVQNEPGKKQWESMEWTTDELASFTRDHLISALDEAQLNVRLMLNEETDWRPNRMIDGLLADETIAAATDIVAAHAYNRTHIGQKPIASAAALGKPVWMTEFYLGDYRERQRTDPLDRALYYGQVMDSYFDEAQVNAFLFWWAVSPADKAVQGLVEVDLDQRPMTDWTPRKFAYVFGHFSRYVQPGWHRLPSEISGAPKDVTVTAFAGPEGGLAIVLINNTDTPQTITLHLNGNAPPAQLAVVTTDATRNSAPSPDAFCAHEGLRIVLPSRSITTAHR